MSSGFLPPPDYKTPLWPSLYWPVTDPLNHGYFMYYPKDIWQFTTYWTLIFIVSIYTMAGLWAFIVFSRRRYKWAILLPVFFFVTGAFIAFLSGSLVGKGELKPPLAVATCTHHGPWITDISFRNGTGRDTEREGEAGRGCRLFKEEYEEAVGTIWI